MDRHTIKVGYPDGLGHSTTRVYEDEHIYVAAGRTSSCAQPRQAVSSVRFSRVGVEILGGPEFTARVRACASGDDYRALANEALVDALKAAPTLLFDMLAAERENGAKEGYKRAKGELREWLEVY